MRAVVALFIVFIVALIGNAIIPSFLGIYAHAAIPAFLLAIPLCFGAGQFSIIAGLAFAFTGEVFSGLPFGMLTAPFLIAFLVYGAFLRLINIQPLISIEGGLMNNVTALVLGSILVLVFLGSVAGINRVFFSQSFDIMAMLRNSQILIYHLIALVVMVSLIRLCLYKRLKQ
ncbi:MAG: hypothetical protein AAB479_00610 [Patescibacteria group bacterium]